jgi:hypothetical protein
MTIVMSNAMKRENLQWCEIEEGKYKEGYWRGTISSLNLKSGKDFLLNI